MARKQPNIKSHKGVPFFLTIVIVTLATSNLLIISSLPVQANTRSTETSCRSSNNNGRFPHPNRQPCQPRRFRQGR